MGGSVGYEKVQVGMEVLHSVREKASWGRREGRWAGRVVVRGMGTESIGAQVGLVGKERV